MVLKVFLIFFFPSNNLLFINFRVLEESEGEEEVKDFQEVKEILVNLVLLVQLVHLVKMDLKDLGDRLGILVYLDCLERMVSEDSLEKEAHPVKMDHRVLQDNLES